MSYLKRLRTLDEDVQKAAGYKEKEALKRDGCDLKVHVVLCGVLFICS